MSGRRPITIEGLGDFKKLLAERLKDKSVWKGRKLTEKWRSFLTAEPLNLIDTDMADIEKWLLQGAKTIAPNSRGVFKLLTWAEETVAAVGEKILTLAEEIVAAVGEKKNKLKKTERKQFKIALYLKMLAIAYLAADNIENTAERKKEFVNKHKLFVAQMEKIAGTFKKKGENLNKVITTFEEILEKLSPGFAADVAGVQHQLSLQHTPLGLPLHDLTGLAEITRNEGPFSGVNTLSKVQEVLSGLLTMIDASNLQLRIQMPNYFGHLPQPFSQVENNDSLFDFNQEVRQLLFCTNQLGQLHLEYMRKELKETEFVDSLKKIIVNLICLQFNFLMDDGLKTYVKFNDELESVCNDLNNSNLWASAFDFALNKKQKQINDLRLNKILAPLSAFLENSSLIMLLRRIVNRFWRLEKHVDTVWTIIVSMLIKSYQGNFSSKIENANRLEESEQANAKEKIRSEAEQIVKQLNDLKRYIGITDPQVTVEILLTAPVSVDQTAAAAAEAEEPMIIPAIFVTDVEEENDDDAAAEFATVTQGLDALLNVAGQLSAALQSLTTNTAAAGPASAAAASAAGSRLNPTDVRGTMFARSRSTSGSGSDSASEHVSDDSQRAAATPGSSSS